MINPSYPRRWFPTTDEFQKNMEQAKECFWAEIAKNYPEIKTGDLLPWDLITWENTTDSIVYSWINNNLPEKSKGHIAFVESKEGIFELYETENGDIYKANIHNVMDIDNNQRLGRWKTGWANAKTYLETRWGITGWGSECR